MLDFINKTLALEGGYVNHPADKGGPTKYGITLRTLRSVQPGATLKTLKELTVDEALHIYKVHYYYAPKVDALPDKIQDIVFDMNVLHGFKNSNKILQRAVSMLNSTIRIDGIIGPKTINAIWASDLKELRKILNNKRRAFVLSIVDSNPSQSVFLKGWLNRIAEFEKD